MAAVLFFCLKRQTNSTMETKTKPAVVTQTRTTSRTTSKSTSFRNAIGSLHSFVEHINLAQVSTPGFSLDDRVRITRTDTPDRTTLVINNDQCTIVFAVACNPQ